MKSKQRCISKKQTETRRNTPAWIREVTDFNFAKFISFVNATKIAENNENKKHENIQRWVNNIEKLWRITIWIALKTS